MASSNCNVRNVENSDNFDHLDNPSNLLDITPKMPPRQARDYASHVWDLTLCNQKLKVFGFLKVLFDEAVNTKQNSETKLNQEQWKIYEDWKEAIEKEQLKWLQEQASLTASSQNLAMAYQSLTTSEGLMVREPHFIIDVTEPEMKIKIQRQFDVGRQAIAISSRTLSHEEFVRYKSMSDGRFYTDSPHFPPELSATEEQKCFDKLGEEHKRKREWIPEDLARLMPWGCNGRPLFLWNDENWLLGQMIMGYANAESGAVLHNRQADCVQCQSVSQGECSELHLKDLISREPNSSKIMRKIEDTVRIREFGASTDQERPSTFLDPYNPLMRHTPDSFQSYEERVRLPATKKKGQGKEEALGGMYFHNEDNDFLQHDFDPYDGHEDDLSTNMSTISSEIPTTATRFPSSHKKQTRLLSYYGTPPLMLDGTSVETAVWRKYVDNAKSRIRKKFDKKDFGNDRVMLRDEALDDADNVRNEAIKWMKKDNILPSDYVNSPQDF